MRWLVLASTVLLVGLALLGSALMGAGLALACLVSVHVCIGLSRRFASAPASLSVARWQHLLAGAIAALVSGLAITLALTFLIGDLAVWPVALVAAAMPAGLVIGWAVAASHESFVWASHRHSLVLGHWRSEPFAVERPYTVTPGERMRHMVCTGPTGSGKSTLIRNLVLQDLINGHGLCVIDPKDDLIDGILPHIPDNRVEDVILFDLADRGRPLGLNPLAGVPEGSRSLAASELIAAFRRYFADAWGARLEHVLRNLVLALLEVPGASLVDVPRLLLDAAYREWVLRHVSNPAVREFFSFEYEQVLRRRADVIEPILNKVGPWLSYPELRAIVSQSENAFDMRRVMDQGLVLFVRIPQGAFGEDISSLLGSLVVAKLQLAAQSRVSLPAGARRPFYLYVDEFQNFATSSFSKIAAESRAFNLGICAAHQYAEQLPRDVQLALDHNAATFIQAVQRRGRHLLEVRRQEDRGEKEPPVYVVTPPQPLGGGDRLTAERVRMLSRQRYGRAPLEAGRPQPSRRPGPSSAGPGSRRDLDEQ